MNFTASAVLQSLHQSVVMKQELRLWMKLSVYFQCPFSQLWSWTEQKNMIVEYGSEVPAGLDLLTVIGWEAQELRRASESQLHWIEGSQLKWFGHLKRTHPNWLSIELYQARPTGLRPRGRPRICWRNYASQLSCKYLGRGWNLWLGMTFSSCCHPHQEK